MKHSKRAGMVTSCGIAIILALATIAGVLSIAAPAAASATDFCTLGSGAGQCNDPNSIAVDQSSGAVYVGDFNNWRIDEFSSTGAFVRAFGFGVRNGANELQACEAVCISGLQRQTTAPGTIRPQALAAAAGSVYAFDSYYRVEKYGSAGNFELMFGSEVDQTKVKEFHEPGDPHGITEAEENVCTSVEVATGDVCGAGARSVVPGGFDSGNSSLAIDASGDVWVADGERLERFTPEGAFISEVKLAGAGELAGLAIDTDPLSPSFGDMYTLKPESGERTATDNIVPPSAGEAYTLTFRGYTTRPIVSEEATTRECDEVGSALAALPSIGEGNVKVSRVGYFCRAVFIGALGYTELEALKASGGARIEFEQGSAGTPAVLTKRASDGEALETVDSGGHPAALGIDPASGAVFVSDERSPNYTNSGGTATLLEFSSSGVELDAFGTGEVAGSPQGDMLAFGDNAQRLYLASDAAETGSAAQIFALPAPGPLPEAGGTTARPVGKTSATFCARVDPEGAATTLHFQYIAAKTFQENEEQAREGFSGSQSTSQSSSIGEDFSFQHKVCQTIPGLEPNTSYRFRVVAVNENGTADGEAAVFSTLPAAAIDSTSVSRVTAGSATLDAEINPFGEPTSYYFEYLAQTVVRENEAAGQPAFSGASRAPAQPEALGALEADVPVSQHVQGLQPGSVYRYRVVAINAVAEAHGGPLAGPTRTFTTQLPALSGLPDNRGWELVSPAEKHGAVFKPNGEDGALQAAAGGGAITYLASAPTEEDPAGSTFRAQVLSTRGGDGWVSHDITGPHRVISPLVLGEGWEYRLFSTDLSLSVFQPFGVFEPALSPQASEPTAFLRTDFSSGDLSAFCTSSCYRPFVTGCPKGESCSPSVEEAADVPVGTVFGVSTGYGCSSGFACGPQFVGATGDLAHVVLDSRVALTETPALKGGLYEWSAGRVSAETLRLISTLPVGEAAESPRLGFNDEDARNAVSTDGSRVAWTSAGHLYLRVNATRPQSQISGNAVDGSQCIEAEMACTIQLDALQGGPGGQAFAAQFQLASTDGRRIFFTDTQQLTENASSPHAGGDLYEYDLTRPAGERLVDLTPAQGSEASGVLGAVLGAGEDGSYLYFVANGALASGASPGDCGSERADTCNLYARHDGATTLVATLSGEDSPDWASGGADLHNLTARVSPDGRWLEFMSSGSLTGYDNRDAISGRPDEEVFLYHAPAGAGAGRLVCASCNPTDARPLGVEYATGSGFSNIPLAGGTVAWGHTWIAASIPGWTQFSSDQARYQSRYLSDSGRLFFNSSDALVPQDTNGQEDVYQYEPPSGVETVSAGDTCTELSPIYDAASGGCVDLISSGTSPTESGFLDASESGGDVFFLTSAKLSYLDFDSALDVYDARVGGGDVEPARPVECAGDACQAPAIAPSVVTPSSLTFSGAGNPASPVTVGVASKTRSLSRAQKLARALRACRAKRSKHRRAVCEKRARRAYGSIASAGGSRRTITPRKGGK